MEETKLFAKKRDKKIYITDVAIKKVPLIQYRGLNDRESDVLLILSSQRCAVVVLHNHPSTQTLSIEDIRFNPAPITQNKLNETR